MERKTCSKCGAGKPVTEFTFKNLRTGTRHCQCRDCTREQVRLHYQAHQSYYVRKARQRKAKVIAEQREWVLSYLALHPCVDCGETDPRCLDFDHVREQKRCDISRMLGNYGWETIAKEIGKCEVRCANCHRKRTAERRKLAKW
jgi:hypothetical protein